jgi:hypothetical protein
MSGGGEDSELAQFKAGLQIERDTRPQTEDVTSVKGNQFEVSFVYVACGAAHVALGRCACARACRPSPFAQADICSDVWGCCNIFLCTTCPYICLRPTHSAQDFFLGRELLMGIYEAGFEQPSPVQVCRAVSAC